MPHCACATHVLRNGKEILAFVGRSSTGRLIYALTWILTLSTRLCSFERSEGLSLDEETAREALRESVVLLPEGHVKTAISADLESYSMQLKRCGAQERGAALRRESLICTQAVTAWIEVCFHREASA